MAAYAGMRADIALGHFAEAEELFRTVGDVHPADDASGGVT
jgi:hypothetical protein